MTVGTHALAAGVNIPLLLVFLAAPFAVGVVALRAAFQWVVEKDLPWSSALPLSAAMVAMQVITYFLTSALQLELGLPWWAFLVNTAASFALLSGLVAAFCKLEFGDGLAIMFRVWIVEAAAVGLIWGAWIWFAPP